MIDRTKAPELLPYPRLVMPEPQTFLLDNGVEVNVIDNGEQPVNRLTFCYAGGLVDADNPSALKLAGMAMTEGAHGMTGANISEIFDYNGAWLKVDSSTHYMCVNMHTLSKTTKSLLPVVSNIINNPTFPEAETVAIREKTAALLELNRKKVSYVSREKANVMTFGADHPMSRVETPEEIRGISELQLQEAHKAVFRHSPPVIWLSGDVKDVVDDVVETFGSAAYAVDKRPQITARPMSPAPGLYDVSLGDTNQAAVAFSQAVIGREHPDYIDLRTAIMALGGYFGSRLVANIREDKGLTYGIHAALLGYNDGGQLSISSQTDERYVEAVIGETINEIRRMQAEPMSRGELDIVVKHSMTTLAAMLDSPFTIADHHISRLLSTIPGDYFNLQIEALNRLTPERIMQVMRDHIDVDKLIVVTAK